MPRRLAIFLLCVGLLLASACGTDESDPLVGDNTASPSDEACALVAMLISEHVDTARSILGEQAPAMIEDFQAVLAADKRGGQKRVDAAYQELKDTIDALTKAANDFLNEIQGVATTCDPSADVEEGDCFEDALAAYEFAAQAAVASMQGPLQEVFTGFEVLFTAAEQGTKEFKQAFVALSRQAKSLREEVSDFATAQSAAADAFNTCVEG